MLSQLKHPPHLSSSIAPSAITVHSWVSHGHVGHGAASFVLMRMGVRVTMVPCVVYSSSLTYDKVGGAPLEKELIESLCDGISHQPEFPLNSAIWTGFMGTPAAGLATINLLEKLRNHPDNQEKKIVYICDPVLGDRGKMYVPEEMRDVYKKHMLQHADVILPNRYEAGWLIDKDAPPANLEEAKEYAEILLSTYEHLSVVIITGILDEDSPFHLDILLQVRGEAPVVAQVHHFDDRHFAGAGDLFSGIFSAECIQGASYIKAFLSAAGRTSAIIEATHRSGRYELRLVENQSIFDLDFAQTEWAYKRIE